MSAFGNTFKGFGDTFASKYDEGKGKDRSGDFLEKVFNPKRGGIQNTDSYFQQQGYAKVPGGYKSGRMFVSDRDAAKRAKRDSLRNVRGLGDQALQIITEDYRNATDAANEFTETKRAAAEDFLSANTSNVEDLKTLAESQPDKYNKFAERVEGFGQEGLDTFATAFGEGRQLVGAQVEKAGDLARAAVEGVEDRRVESIATLSAAIKSRTDRQAREASMSAFNPDGSKRTPEQIVAEERLIRDGAARELGQAANELALGYSRQKTGAQLAEANTAIEGGKIIAGFELGGQANRNMAQQLANHMIEVGAGLRVAGESARVAGMNYATQMDNAGRKTYFDMLAQSPYESLALFPGFAQLIGLLSAEGIGQVPALQMTPL